MSFIVLLSNQLKVSIMVYIYLICLNFARCRWAEFSDKRIAKRVANMLNGEQIGMYTDQNYAALVLFLFFQLLQIVNAYVVVQIFH